MDVQGEGGHQESILNTIKDLYNQQTFSDIIVISSQKTYNCHKVILSSKGGWGVNLKNSNRIDCSKFNDKVVERILKWVYLGVNVISSEDSLEFLTQLVNVGEKLNLNRGQSGKRKLFVSAYAYAENQTEGQKNKKDRGLWRL